jgi:uncharacterized lipoprotein YmbA
MDSTGFRSKGYGFLCVVLFMGGCISIPNSPTPRFYALSVAGKDQLGKAIKAPFSALVGIGPVKLPEYLDRPQIVTEDKWNMLQFAQFDRWGGSLDLGLARLVREDIAILLPGAKLNLYPWNPSIAVKYQVIIEVVELDSQLDGDMHFAVQWTVIGLQDPKTVIIKRSDFRTAINPHNYSGLAQTLSNDCSSLSVEIAQELASLK